MKKQTIFTSIILMVVIILAYFVLAGPLVVQDTNIITPKNGTNLSGTIVLNASFANTTLNITNVTFSWSNTTSAFVLNVTIFNKTAGDGNFSNNSFDTSLLVDGTYNITVNTTNVTNQSYKNTSLISIVIDNTPPVVTINSPSGPNINYSTGNVSFNATVTDALAGVQQVKFQFSNGTNPFNLTASNQSGTWNVSLNITIAATTGIFIADGNHTVTVYANDTAGSANNTQTLAFTVDRTPPNTTIHKPSGSNVNLSGNYMLNVTIKDATLDVTSFHINISNATSLGIYNFTPVLSNGNSYSSYNFTWQTGNGSFADGIYFIRIHANDTVNNTNATTNMTVRVDNTAPAVAYNSPSGANINYSNGNVSFNVTVTDNLAGVASVVFQFSNGTNPFNLTAANQSGTWNVSLNITLASTTGVLIADGNHTVTVFVNDTAGNTNNTQTLNFAVDRTPPAVAFVFPTRGANVSGDFFINVTVNDATLLTGTVIANLTNTTNLGFLSNNTNFTLTSTLSRTVFNTTWISDNGSYPADGSYYLTIIANDSVNNVNKSVNVTFTVDNTPPVFTVPYVAAITSSGAIAYVNVTDVTTGISSCRVTSAGVNEFTSGGVMNNASGTFSFTITGLTAATPYIANISCNDFAGNIQNTLKDLRTLGGAAASSSSSGGGGAAGSAGGVATGATGKFEQKTWASINKGETAVVDVENGVIGVTQVSFTVDETANGVWVKVARLDNLPTDVAKPTTKVYRNIKITSNSANKVSKGAKEVSFKVEKSWLTQNSLNKNDIALHHYVDDKWEELTTTVGKDDGTYVHFTAQTLTFSYFVVAAKEKPTPTAAAVAEPEGETPESAPTTTTADETPEMMAKEPSVWLWAVIVLAILIAAGLVYWLFVKGKK